jgi:tetratricopeptide (TPR) repeat protein
MTQKELIRKFLNLEDEDEEILEAWYLLIETQKAFRDVEARTISRREADNVRRTFLRYMGKHGLKTLDEEAKGLKAHEVALVKGSAEGEGDKLKPQNYLDLWLLTDFEELCALWVSEDLKQMNGFPDTIIAFLKAPYLDARLKERLIEKDKERGERILKTILEERPAEVAVHTALVKHYEREDRQAEAEAEYKRMLSVTDDELVWANYGTFLEMRGSYDEAFEAFKKSFESCERLGEVETGLGEMVKSCLSRVERMKNLEGDEAKKARGYMEALWLIDELQEFAQQRFEAEIGNAGEEYKKEFGIDTIGFEAVSDFSNWFLFTRKLGDGRTPGMVYAEEKMLSEALKEKIQGLGKPVKGSFELVKVDHASFRLVVKDVKTEVEYEVRADLPHLKEGLRCAGTLYPWGDFYLTRGTLSVQKGAE